MTKAVRFSLVVILLVFMVGCAQQTWQAKGTAVYVAAGKTLKAADSTFQELKGAGLISPEKITKYNGLYKQAYDSYWLAGDAWKISLRAGTSIEQDKYLEAFYKNFGDFQKFVSDLVVIVNGTVAKQGGTK
jgi:hypothetical protein